MDRQQEFVLRTIEERDIRFVRLWFTDVLGTLKSVAIAPAELEGAFAEGIGFDGSVIEGFARVFEFGAGLAFGAFQFELGLPDARSGDILVFHNLTALKKGHFGNDATEIRCRLTRIERGSIRTVEINVW